MESKAIIPDDKEKRKDMKGEKIRLVVSGFTEERKKKNREQWSREWKRSKRS